MKQNLYLANRLREVLLNGRWIANTNYKEQLEATNWQQAVQKVGNLNTIAMLTFHINYYLGGLLKVFAGGPLAIKDKYSFHVSAMEAEEDWLRLVNDFLNNAEAFAIAVEQLDDARLDEPFVQEKYGSYLRNIEGVIEHSYYHLGQIVMLRKVISEKATGL